LCAAVYKCIKFTFCLQAEESDVSFSSSRSNGSENGCDEEQLSENETSTSQRQDTPVQYKCVCPETCKCRRCLVDQNEVSGDEEKSYCPKECVCHGYFLPIDIPRENRCYCCENCDCIRVIPEDYVQDEGKRSISKNKKYGWDEQIHAALSTTRFEFFFQ